MRRASALAVVLLVLSACGVDAPELGEGFVDRTPDYQVLSPPFALHEGSDLYEPGASWALLTDLEADGELDLLVSGLGPMVPFVVRYVRGPDGGWEQRTAPMESEGISAAVDLDRDGFVDLISLHPAPHVRFGLGGGAFTEPVRPAPNVRSGYGMALADVDHDGWLDLVLGDHGCGPETTSRIIPRTGLRTFGDGTGMITARTKVSTYVTFAAAHDARGPLITVFGARCDPRDTGPMAFAATARAEDGTPRFEPTERIPSSVLGRAPMGAAGGDLDGDGRQDVVISVDPELWLFAGEGDGFVDRTNDSFRESRGPRDVPMIPWGVATIDFDRDGRLDLVAAHGNDFEQFQKQEIGPQFVTAHWNGGDFQFADVSAALGLTREGQWRALSIGDLDGDAAPDLLVGGMGELPRIYENHVQGGHGLALRLRGTSSNVLAIGSRVEVTAEGRTQSFVVSPHGSPLVWTEPMVFAGVGAATSADVRIVWPTGAVQRLPDVATDRIVEIAEPPLFEISPASRHLPADGASVATITITPRREDGALRTDAQVEVRRAFGAGEVQSVTRDPEGTWIARVRAPSAPGSVVLELVIDGQPAGIAPRLFFDSP